MDKDGNDFDATFKRRPDFLAMKIVRIVEARIVCPVGSNDDDHHERAL
jgi:hypothetical protein